MRLKESSYNITKLKEVDAGDTIVWAELEGDTMWVKWNEKGGKPYSKRSEWLRHVKGPLFSTMTAWDELDDAIAALGVTKVDERSHIEDWGNDDTDIFTTYIYDFSPVLGNNMNLESRNMNNTMIRLTESDLHRIIRESVNRILKEHYNDYPRNDEMLEATMNDAKLFLRDYGSYYRDYVGPSYTISGGDYTENILRSANDLYLQLKHQNCKDKKLMKTMEDFIQRLSSK